MQDYISIPLGEYGFDGAIEMAKPSFRKVNDMKNAISNVTRMRASNGQTVVERTNIGDIEIIGTLSYVRSAPFPVNLEGFLDFCDVLDHKSVGSAQRLWDKMLETVKAIDEGGTSPFAGSPTQETGSSA